MRPRLLLPLLTALALLLGAAPALAGGLVELDGATLRFTGDQLEPSAVTIDDVGGMLTLDDDASRMTVPAGSTCTVTQDGYHVECPDLGVQQIAVRLGLLGSDVRIRADLPANVQGGPGDDLIAGGPADDTIDGGPGQDIIAGGGGADVLDGGSGQDLVTYVDRIAADGTLLARRTGVRVAIGKAGYSGAPGEGDTIGRDVEQLQGGDGNDRFSLRDGRATEVSCGGGRDAVDADPRDVLDIDCESATVAPQPGGSRLTVATLPFPFPGVNDRGVSTIAVKPVLPLQRGAVVLRVSCPAGLGLLELVRAAPCTGKVRFTRSDGVAMGAQRVRIARGGAANLRLPLTSSRTLARRAGGLALTATALPDRAPVQRKLRLTVHG